MGLIKTLYKVELLKNVSERFEDDNTYTCIAHGNIVDKNNIYDEYQRMINIAYDDIISGKMEFSNIPHFSVSYVAPHDYNGHRSSIGYVINGNHETVTMVYCSDISVLFYDDGTISFDDSYVVSKFKDKLYLVCVDTCLNGGFGSVIMEFDQSISEHDLINSVTEYLRDHVYNQDD